MLSRPPTHPPTQQDATHSTTHPPTHPPTQQVEVIAIGTPRVGDDTFSAFYRMHVNGRSPAFMGQGIRFRGRYVSSHPPTHPPTHPPIQLTFHSSTHPPIHPSTHPPTPQRD